MLNSALFDVVLKENPEVKYKLIPIEGDFSKPNMGISSIDIQTLLDNVNIIFHSAATVRFDEDIKSAIEINIYATRELLKLCRKMINLKSVIHISTCYANCPTSRICEKFYDMPITPEQAFKYAHVDNDTLNFLTPQ